MRLALTTGLVAAFFSVLYQAVEEFLGLDAHDQFHELIVIAVTSIGMLAAIEPILERIVPLRARESSRREDNLLIRAGAFFTIVATSMLHGLLHGHISQSINAHGMVVLEQLLTALVAPTLITLSWIYGVRHEQPRAKWFGLAAGVVAGLGMVVFAIAQIYLMQPETPLGQTAANGATTTVAAVVASSLWFILPSCAVNGYLGGLAIDRRWRGKAWRGIGLGLMIAVAVEAAAFLIAASIEWPVIRSSPVATPELIKSLIVEAMIANLGWTIGLWVRPDADSMLRVAEQAEAVRDFSKEMSTAVTSVMAMLVLGLVLSLGGILIGRNPAAAAILSRASFSR